MGVEREHDDEECVGGERGTRTGGLRLRGMEEGEWGLWGYVKSVHAV